MKTAKLGKTKLRINWYKYDYIGQTDVYGKACGWGVATKIGGKEKIEGSFLNDLPNGLCKSLKP